ncbi:MAG: aspartyl-tRNA(Asn)/glutamyl-tRNA(Gln) amidotransferase subunit C [Planctomycetota bacterium]|jgi:aspartyl-tRNA(Asn)/glutamyl-tRNA(Gln) amidotransferase subunit C
MVGPDEVKRIAALARIEMDPTKVESFAKQLEKMLDFVSSLDALDVTDVPPMMHASAGDDVFREDVVGECMDRATALKNAADHDGEQIRVPKTV